MYWTRDSGSLFIEGCDLFFLTIQCIIFLGLLGFLEHPRFNIRNLTQQIQHLKKILEQMQELSKGTPGTFRRTDFISSVNGNIVSRPI